MKSAFVIAGLCILFLVGFVVLPQSNAGAKGTTVASRSVTDGLAAMRALGDDFQLQPKKRCSFNSDCRYGKCKKSRCGGCSFNSDCKGWGKCKRGWCGGCSFNSDCKGFGSCSHGHCTKSPY